MIPRILAPIASTSRVAATRQIHRACVAANLHTTAHRKRIFDDFVNIHDDAERPAIEVKTITDSGFQFVDGLLVPSPCIFINGTLFMWDAPPVPEDLKWTGWTSDHFKIFDVVSPRPEILLIGTGKSMMPLPPFLKKYLNGLGLQVDVQDSWNACSTYNMLAEEGRRVSAAVLPMKALSINRTSA